MFVLKSGKDMTVRQSQVGVRVHVSAHVRERGHNLRLQWVANVKDERPTGIMVIGEQHAAGRHGVLGVMDAHRLLIRYERGHEMSVGGGCRIGVDHCQKVVALMCQITGPGEQVVTCRWGLSGRLRGKRYGSSKDEAKCYGAMWHRGPCPRDWCGAGV